MASDISNIINSELINTFESLLSVSSTVDDIAPAAVSEIDEDQCIKVTVKMEAGDIASDWKFYIPTLIATKFEYFMLGGIGDLKSSIDDEILDATKEIVNTIGGSLSTTINAQDFDDVKSSSFTMQDGEIVQITSLGELENLYRFDITFNDENVALFIEFDEAILPFVGKIVSGEEIVDEEEEVTSNAPAISGGAASILSLLGEESTENLKLLFDVKLKFSVRLGTKTFLLKDIVNWDIGQIIELEQMVNEPLDILINGTKVGEGEAVIVEGRFGVKIKYIGEKKIEV
jgi:flagellar motor switch protein FliN/FliY